MTKTLTPQPKIMEIDPYIGGKAPVKGASNMVKLSSNENPFGASPAAKEAFLAEAEHLAVYPSSDHHDLRAALAELHGLDADRIMMGNGSDEIIDMLCKAYAGAGDEVLFTEHGFAMYRISALANGATPVSVPEKNRVTDVDALLDGVTEATKIVFIANPNNPTGTMIDLSEIERLADGLPDTCLLVLDGAYAEYVEGYDGGASLVETRANVCMTRTFSKIYGLGGMRLGWLYAPSDVIDVLGRIKGPFNVNSAALAAGLAAVADQDYIAKCREANAKWRDWLADELRANGMPVDPSEGNFILVQFSSQAEAEAANATLADNGLIVRQVGSYGLPEFLRITIGKEHDCKRIATVLRDFKKARSS